MTNVIHLTPPPPPPPPTFSIEEATHYAALDGRRCAELNGARCLCLNTMEDAEVFGLLCRADMWSGAARIASRVLADGATLPEMKTVLGVYHRTMIAWFEHQPWFTGWGAEIPDLKSEAGL